MQITGCVCPSHCWLLWGGSWLCHALSSLLTADQSNNSCVLNLSEWISVKLQGTTWCYQEEGIKLSLDVEEFAHVSQGKNKKPFTVVSYSQSNWKILNLLEHYILHNNYKLFFILFKTWSINDIYLYFASSHYLFHKPT